MIQYVRTKITHIFNIPNNVGKNNVQRNQELFKENARSLLNQDERSDLPTCTPVLHYFINFSHNFVCV